jgi:hypothetical protein
MVRRLEGEGPVCPPRDAVLWAPTRAPRPGRPEASVCKSQARRERARLASSQAAPASQASSDTTAPVRRPGVR